MKKFDENWGRETLNKETEEWLMKELARQAKYEKWENEPKIPFKNLPPKQKMIELLLAFIGIACFICILGGVLALPLGLLLMDWPNMDIKGVSLIVVLIGAFFLYIACR